MQSRTCFDYLSADEVFTKYLLVIAYSVEISLRKGCFNRYRAETLYFPVAHLTFLAAHLTFLVAHFTFLLCFIFS